MSQIAASVLGMLAIACAAPAPVQRGPDVHFVNLIGNAVVVGNLANAMVGNEPSPQHVVRPCGGARAVGAVDFTTSDGRLLLMVAIDPSGLLDDAVANWVADLDEMDGSFTVDPIWSRGDIPIAELPKWIVVRPEGVEIASTEPLTTASPSCAPWPEILE